MSKTEKEKIVEDINEEALIENKGIAFKRKRSGMNFLLTLAILAVFAASGFSLIYVVESSVFEVGNLNIVDFAIISYNAFVEFIGTAPSIESFISYQNVAFIFVIAAIIFFALSGVYCILASFFNLIRRRTDRLFDLFARSFTSSLTVTLLISLLSRNISGVSVYGTVKFIPGIGLMAVSALGVAVVMLFYFKERRVAISRQIAEKERIARRNALMGFIGYALIFAVAAYSSHYETIYYCYELLFSLIESLIGGYFSLSALLLTAFCVIPTLTLLISGFKALYGIFYDVPFALNVNQAIPEATSV